MMIEEVAEFIDSDTEIITAILLSQSVTIQRPKERVGATYNIRNGEFFPYTHDFNDPDLVTELANLGCWMSVEPENYNNNCLWLACKSAGVSDKTLEAMKFEFLQRKISRKNIRKIAERHNLCVKIRTDGDKNIIVYGNEKAEGVTKVELAIITEDTGDHYIHFYDTKFTSYSILNYDQVKDRKNWWNFKSDNRRDASRGMNSLDLLRTILKTNHCKAIDITTEGIFRTQFYDRFKTSEFNTLEYAPEYATPFHEARSGEPQIACEKLGKVRKAIMNKKGGDKVLEVLDSKFTAQGFGNVEQLKHLKRALRNLVEAEIFFDFEASPYDKHEDYICRYSEFNEEEIHEVRTLAGAERSGEGFLKQLLAKYGAVDPNNGKKFEPPTIKLLAHNLTYDYSFIAPYLKRVNLTETKNTKIICGSALYSEVIETPMLNKPNNQILQWLKENGTRLLGSSNVGLCKAYRALTACETFIASASDLEKIKGIEKKVKEVLASEFDWEILSPEPIINREFRAVEIVFQDTIKMIDMPLSKFGKSFGLAQSKEIFPHSLMTNKFIISGGIATLQQLKKACEKDQLDCNELLRKLEECPGAVVLGSTSSPQYNMINYSSHYCELDVKVLKEGWRVFRNLILDKYQLDTFHYPTLASLSDQYFIDQGCFDEVYQLAGVPRAFIANCTIGGRVMCANNKRSHTKKKLADFDGVSLYPSAMKRLGALGGYLKGAPKVWRPEIDLNIVDGYFLKIKVTSIGKRYRFPITRIKDVNGGCNWTNDLVGKEIFVDRFTLEDLVKHSEITYTILQGYYFDEGRNPKIEKTITTLFEERLRIKAEIKRTKVDNPLQLIIKLMMNAAYGKTGLKPIDSDVKYVSPENKTNFIQNHFNHIKCWTDMPNGQSRIELYKEIDTHYNRQHIACEILSMSKVIMNEVMCLAEDIEADIEYTDTDSMHIDFDKVIPLADAFRMKYDRELIGEELGQFHVDFEDLVKGGGEVWAKESYFLGKKTYIDELTDEQGNQGYHIRMKGIPGKCINAKVKADYNGDPLLLYKDLYEGKPVKFDLKSGGNCCFKTGKDHYISTVAQMTRTVQFPLTEETQTSKRKRDEEDFELDFEQDEESEEYIQEEEGQEP
jgi:hypothetical protein